jgi:SpoIIAA-like
MIEELGNLPTGVVGFAVGGRLRAEDYRDVVLPALERAAATGEIRFVIVIDSFDGMTGGAVWQDLKLGFEHLRAWKRIAVVTDISWMTHLTDLFGWMTPGSTKTFPLSEQAAAIAWVAAEDPTAT